MSVPQIKEGPASMLRAMFAGFGSLMSVKDKRRSKHAAEAPADAQAPAPEATAPETTAEPEPTAEPETVVAETTAEPEPTAEPEATVVAEATAEPETVVAWTTTEPETVVAEVTVEIETAAEPEAVVVEAVVVEAVEAEAVVVEISPETEAGSALPLANYDELSVASLRARLRNLSVEQLTQLIGYEKGHAGRADVIAMFERRIAKVESEA
jgi:hypothetical protein